MNQKQPRGVRSERERKDYRRQGFVHCSGILGCAMARMQIIDFGMMRRLVRISQYVEHVPAASMHHLAPIEDCFLRCLDLQRSLVEGSSDRKSSG